MFKSRWEKEFKEANPGECKDIENKIRKLAFRRLDVKKQCMKNLLKIATPDEALYRKIMLSLGYKKIRHSF